MVRGRRGDDDESDTGGRGGRDVRRQRQGSNFEPGEAFRSILFSSVPGYSVLFCSISLYSGVPLNVLFGHFRM